MNAPCPLCDPAPERVLWQDAEARVILADEPGYPGLCRVIWRDHVREMTDLLPPARARLLELVLAVEAALRTVLAPDKVNLASLGNVVPHLHWHVIPRFADDPSWPGAVWAPRAREGAARAVDVEALAAAIAAAVATAESNARFRLPA